MRAFRRLLRGVWLLAAAALVAAQSPVLGTPERIADGVELYTFDDPSLLDPPGPIAVQALRLDPRRVVLRSALARARVPAREGVVEMAAREGAIAAVNGGFFGADGSPAGLLKAAGDLVSDTRRVRGAVAVIEEDGATRLLFDLVTARVVLNVAGRTAQVSGVDATPGARRLTLLTPAWQGNTAPAGGGVAWRLRGSPLTVVERKPAEPDMKVPEDGFLLTYGGRDPPPPLERLVRGRRVALDTQYHPRLGSPPERWNAAAHVVGGAGLLAVDGRYLDDWSPENLTTGFETTRHPRTLVGADADGDVWLVAVDGRQPDLSLGMTFAELQSLARRIGLRSALNLDGGGSTTMVVRGAVVNHPSDAAGPRAVSDALVVLLRNEERGMRNE
jgi:hypothetical protein